MLPGEISKTKWSKKAKEVVSWEDWWEMHDKVSIERGEVNLKDVLLIA